MRSSVVVRDRESWAMQAAILGMAVLVFVVGFCVFDSHDGMDEHAGVDLCAGMLAGALIIVLVPGLPLTGLASVDRPAPVRRFSPHVPAPPPKHFS